MRNFGFSSLILPDNNKSFSLEQSEFDRLSRADQMAQIKETFMGALEQRAVGRIQRRTEQIQNPEEVGGEQMNLLREKRQQFYSDFKAWAESRFNGKRTINERFGKPGFRSA